MANLKTGDVVKLQSGGPKMTIQEVARDGKMSCVWFDGPTVYMGLFVEGSLRILPPEDPNAR